MNPQPNPSILPPCNANSALYTLSRHYPTYRHPRFNPTQPWLSSPPPPPSQPHRAASTIFCTSDAFAGLRSRYMASSRSAAKPCVEVGRPGHVSSPSERRLGHRA